MYSVLLDKAESAVEGGSLWESWDGFCLPLISSVILARLLHPFCFSCLSLYVVSFSWIVSWSVRPSAEWLRFSLGMMFDIGLDAAFKCCCNPNYKYCKISLISYHCTMQWRTKPEHLTVNLKVSLVAHFLAVGTGSLLLFPIDAKRRGCRRVWWEAGNNFLHKDAWACCKWAGLGVWSCVSWHSSRLMLPAQQDPVPKPAYLQVLQVLLCDAERIC